MMDDVRNKQARASDSPVGPWGVTLKVVNLSNSQTLAGAEFKLTYPGPGAEETQLICNGQGQSEFTVNDLGTWTLEETKAPTGYQLNSTPIYLKATASGVELLEPTTVPFVELKNDEFILGNYILTVKNTKIPTSPDLTKTTKYVTNNSLAELIRLVKAQSSKVLNVTVNHTIDTYTPMGTPTAKKKFYADIPCTQSKTTMNVQISPNDSVENPGLLTYAEPMNGKVRVYFSEQPTSPYIVDSVELTPVTSIIPPKIYGIQRDITNSSPEWTRTDDAVGMTATASEGDVAGHSDFSKVMPWKGMVRETLSTGDVMVRIPKFYFRRYREGNIEHIEIANEPVAGFTVHPLFNHAGVEKDFAYIGAYKTSSNNKSVSGANPQVNQTRAVMRNNAKNKGAGWGLIDIAALSAIQMLFLVEYATNDSQKAIGRGYCDENGRALRSGTCNNVPNLTGRPAGTDGKVDVVYRGIEGIWGNVSEWVDGVNLNGKTPYVCNDPSKYADDTSTGYTKLSFNLASSGYFSQEGLDTGAHGHVLLPSATGGSDTTYYCDYGYSASSGWFVLGVLGNWNSGSRCGLFFANYNFNSSGSRLDFGSRLLYIPPSQGGEEHTEITTPVKPSGGGGEEHTEITNTTDRNHVGGDS